MSAKSNRAMLEQAEAKIAEAQAAFNKYDADNSGTIDDIEVLQLMADMGLLEKLKTDKVTFLANYFATADTNGDGVLDFEEFKGFYNAAVDDAAGRGGPTKAASASDKKKAAIAAGALEKKGLPGIEPADQEEVVALSQKLNSKLEPKQQKEWFKIFKKMDEDGSGRITYEEFKDFVRSTGKSKDHGCATTTATAGSPAHACGASPLVNAHRPPPAARRSQCSRTRRHLTWQPEPEEEGHQRRDAYKRVGSFGHQKPRRPQVGRVRQVHEDGAGRRRPDVEGEARRGQGGGRRGGSRRHGRKGRARRQQAP